MFFKRTLNNKGFTLAEVVIAAGIMGGIGVAMMFLMKQQTAQGTKAKIDADLAMVKSQLNTLMVNPASCNANFKGRTVGTTTSPSSIYECQITASDPKCTAAQVVAPTVGYNVASKYVAVPETTVGDPNTDVAWPVVANPSINTPAQLVNNLNLKISKITSTIAGVDAAACAPRCLTTAIVKVEFSEKVIKIVAGNPTISGKKLNSMDFSTVVVTNGTTVLGCPKSWNSTVLY